MPLSSVVISRHNRQAGLKGHCSDGEVSVLGGGLPSTTPRPPLSAGIRGLIRGGEMGPFAQTPNRKMACRQVCRTWCPGY